jgi:hypothetical protein
MPILLGLEAPRFSLATLLPVIGLDRWQLSRLRKRGAIPTALRGGLTYSQAVLLRLGLAIARDEHAPHRINPDHLRHFLATFWEVPRASWEWLRSLPDVQAALDLHKDIFAKRITRSKTTDLNKTFGLGMATAWLPPRNRIA